MNKEFASLRNPGLLWFIIVMLYVVLSFLTFRSNVEWLGIPLVTWLIGGGGLALTGLCLILIPIMDSWERDAN